MKTTLLFCLTLILLSSCHRLSLGPYRNYEVTNDEATPACNMRGIIYRNRR